MIAVLQGAPPVDAPQQRVALRLTHCTDCRKSSPAVSVWDETEGGELKASISRRDANAFLSLRPGYYRIFLDTELCRGDRYLGVLPLRDRDFDVTMKCRVVKTKGITVGRIVDGMRGLAGILPESVVSVSMRPADGSEDPILATLSHGAYYFDEANCESCVLDIMLPNRKTARVGVDLTSADNFSLTRHDLSLDAIGWGIRVRGSPFNSPDKLVEGPLGSIWSLDKLGNRVVEIQADGRCREYELPTQFSDAGDIIGTPDFVWVSERRAGKVVRFAQDGSFAEFNIARNVDLGYSYRNFRMIRGADGRIWYVDNAILGAIDVQGNAKTYADGLPVFWLGDLALGADGRIWVVGRASSYGEGSPFVAAIDRLGHWQRFPLTHDAATILAGKSGLWIAGGYDFLSYVDLGGREVSISLPIAGMEPHLYVVDSSGRLWFSDRYGNIIAHVDSRGTVAATYTDLGRAGVSDMATDEADDIWIAEPKARAIEEYRKRFAIAPPAVHPKRILFDSGGNLWYSDGAADVIGVIRRDGRNACYALTLSHVRTCKFQEGLPTTEP
ncbi:MAG TPA: hypothetical protein VFA29_07925 [Candidatus Baltobacteraceae bacterium]|nr:hypothetical protein [Candidatus Baltobacteraceae bacterium]